MTSRLARKKVVSLRPQRVTSSGFYRKVSAEQEQEEPVNSSASFKVGPKVNTDWDEVAIPPAPSLPGPETRTHYKECNRCHQKKDVANFEGFKRCKDCRDRVTRNWHKTMESRYAAGVSTRIPVSEDERERTVSAFDHACAFCGNRDDDKVRLTRLIGPREGGGDDLFNIIPCCTSCMQSRKGWANWEDWYRAQPEMYSGFRRSRIVAWHNEMPLPKPPTRRDR